MNPQQSFLQKTGVNGGQFAPLRPSQTMTSGQIGQMALDKAKQKQLMASKMKSSFTNAKNFNPPTINESPKTISVPKSQQGFENY